MGFYFVITGWISINQSINQAPRVNWEDWGSMPFAKYEKTKLFSPEMGPRTRVGRFALQWSRIGGSRLE